MGRKKGGGLDPAVAYYAAKTFLISTPPAENVKCIATCVRPSRERDKRRKHVEQSGDTSEHSPFAFPGYDKITKSLSRFMNVFEIRARSPSYCCPLDSGSTARELFRALSYHAHDNVYVRDRP